MFRTLMLCLLLSFGLVLNHAAATETAVKWHTVDSQGQLKIPLYFIWSKSCPHCKEAHPFIDSLPQKYPWIELHAYRLGDAETLAVWQTLAEQTNTAARSVPYMAACGKAVIGYSSREVTGEFLLNQLKRCYLAQGGSLAPEEMPREVTMTTTPAASDQDSPFATCSSDSGNGACDASEVVMSDVQPVELPLLGVVTPDTMSMPLLTLVLAGVDAFNPCAFFVLLFLLSIMVNAKSRGRMLLVGGIFVFFSGFIYFLFMSAWLNVFQLLGASDGSMIILVAGLLALVAGAINVKEYFFTKGEVSLSMSAENRTSLLKRMGKLSGASSLPAMIVGTTVLAILANAYELLCTAGFPMIYTSVLSMHNFPPVERYMYLLFYNVVYVIPLLAIVVAFSMTLGKRKLTEKEGKTLKLMSGIMMLGLGGTLAVNPTALQNVTVAIGLILGAIVVTIVITLVRKMLARSRTQKSA
ncbi:cytochrome C biosynthesis protein [Shewanella sp. YIC-542]|uniref:cytochrome C biosynthesis protein n=1 Tax=Shewanella mytili TaxID=3377111 RepID=UPI00398F13F3